MKSKITEITDLAEALRSAKPHLQIESCFSSAAGKPQESLCTSPEYLLQNHVISAFEKFPKIFEEASEEYFELRSEETPLLLSKSQRNWRCATPDFTEEEQDEREFMVETLNRYVIYLKYGVQEGDEGVPNQLTSDEMEIDNVFDVAVILIFNLYFLARCGDESAFLELLNLESTFVSHPFFCSSFLSWQLEARAGNKVSQEILKNLSSCLAKSIDSTRSKLGRPFNEGSFNILKGFQSFI